MFPETDLTPLSDAELARICDEYPAAPQHYVDSLRFLGWGDIGDGCLTVFSGLVTPEDVFDPVRAAGLAGVVFWGSDWGGVMFGFACASGWALVEVGNLDDRPVPRHEPTLAEFFARLADGHDDGDQNPR